MSRKATQVGEWPPRELTLPALHMLEMLSQGSLKVQRLLPLDPADDRQSRLARALEVPGVVTADKVRRATA